MRSGGPGASFLDAAWRGAEAATMASASAEAKHIDGNAEAAKAPVASRKQSHVSAYMTQLTPEQNDPEAVTCERVYDTAHIGAERPGSAAVSAWYGHRAQLARRGWLQGKPCTAELC
eukprot:363868-Chlamydomonas_euryale.AAC.7